MQQTAILSARVSRCAVAPLKRKGDLAELMVAADLARQGYRVAFPYGEDWEADLLIDRGGRIERIQVKHTTPTGDILEIRARSHSLTNGKVRQTRHYTAETIEWLAAFNPRSGGCYYIPAAELGAGRFTITLRLGPTRNNQRIGVRMAADYAALPQVEPAGFEPAAFRMQSGRSTN